VERTGPPGSRRERGFTLIEILVAFAVLGIGISVFVTLFSSSLALAKNSRSQTVAVSLAEAQLHDILSNFAAYQWPAAAIKPETLVEMGLAGEQVPKPHSFSPPAVMPVGERADQRERAFYERFRWQAYVRLPHQDSDHVEVCVVVRWTEAGRDLSETLTTVAPRARLSGGEGSA
jgi:prepilin-type N-terminal cleavage/methylation domain-containing protein